MLRIVSHRSYLLDIQCTSMIISSELNYIFTQLPVRQTSKTHSFLSSLGSLHNSEYDSIWHALCRIDTPLPHVTEQELQSLHRDHAEDDRLSLTGKVPPGSPIPFPPLTSQSATLQTTDSAALPLHIVFPLMLQ